VHAPWSQLPAADKKKLWDGSKEFFGVKGLFAYLEDMKYKMHVRVFIARYRSPFICPECHGSRLRKEAHHVTLNLIAFKI
jgi:excinuclease ABC subunit A